jgi:benzylsuccinate CoA-transferase BbsF subunit
MGGPVGALSGIRVCDLSGQLAGAGATRYLAAFGAEVIRIEDPTNQGSWDIVRGAPPYIDDRRGIEFGGGFNNYNVGKLGVTLNLRTDRGKELLRSLIRVSDVVTENFAAGVFARMGFSYPSLKEIRQDIIYVSNCGFGQTGPYQSFRTWGPTVQACSGLAFESGISGQEPAGWGYSYMDHMGANFMAIGILAAVVHRQRTGDGQWVDMACTEAAATLTGTAMLDASVNSRPTRRAGSVSSNRSEHPAMAPHGIYPSSGDDCWIAIACRDDSDWERLCSAVGAGWFQEEKFHTLSGRLANQDELDQMVSRWTSARDRFEVSDRLTSAGVPSAPVAKPEDRIDHDPSTTAWGLWPTVHHPMIGSVRVDGLPVHLSRTDWAVERSAPCLGEDNRHVFETILGLTPDEVESLSAQGVV